MSDQSPTANGRNLSAWDPLMDLLRQKIQGSDLIPPAEKKLTRFRRSIVRKRFLIRYKLGRLFLLSMTSILFFSATILLVYSWPWFNSEPSYGGIVAAAATTTAFASLVFSALLVPHASATQIAPGYGAEISSRIMPWLFATLQISITGILFLFSALDPNSHVAVASGLLAAGLFGLSWLVAMRLIADSDPISVASRQAGYLRKANQASMSHATQLLLVGFKKESWAELQNTPVLRSTKNDFTVGFIRHLRSGVDSSIAKSQPALIIPFWKAQIDCFLDYAAECDGAISNARGLELIIDTARDLVSAADRIGGEMDLTVSNALLELESIALKDYQSSEYAAIRAMIINFYTDAIVTTWLNNTSIIPSNLILATGRLGIGFISINAFDDARGTIQRLQNIYTNACVSNRNHLSQSSAEAIVDMVPHLLSAATQNIDARADLIRWWGLAIRDIAAGWPRRNFAIYSSFDLVIPGTSLSGRGLQQVVWRVNLSEQLFSAFFVEICEVIRHCPDALNSNQDIRALVADDPLTLIYWLALVATTTNAPIEVKRQWANELRDLRDACVPQSSGFEMLKTTRVAAMYWSSTVAMAYLADDSEFIALGIGWILSATTSSEIPSNSILRDILLAAKILEGESPENVRAWGVANQPRWGFADDYANLPSHGFTPALNRVQVIASPNLFVALEDWLALKFPQLSG